MIDFEQAFAKAARHLWLALLVNIELTALCAPLVIVALDARAGTLRANAEYAQIFAWWPYVLTALISTVIWFMICEIEPLVRIVFLFPRMIFVLAMYFGRYLPIVGNFFLWLDKPSNKE